MNRLTLDQQIIAMDWTKLNRKQMKAQLIEWQRYFDFTVIFDSILLHKHMLTKNLLAVMNELL